MGTQCGKEEHFPADCVITMPAPAPQYTAPFSGARPAQYSTGAHAAQQYSTEAHVAQYGTHPLSTWTPSDSDNQATAIINRPLHGHQAKSRLVARGFKQREGIDFGETFAPTVSSSCVRLLGALACELDLDVCHFDVEQAFVQSKLDEDVFLRLPRGCGRLSGKVVRLNKSLYGLKQASRSWHAHPTTCLNTLGLQQCLADACVFRLVEEGRIAIIAVVHVDDIFAVGLKSRCDVFRDELNRMVPVKNLGELRWYGGCHYTREREMSTLTISQKTFADELVKK